jgi:hypothetical protein
MNLSANDYFFWLMAGEVAQEAELPEAKKQNPLPRAKQPRPNHAGREPLPIPLAQNSWA